MQHQFDRVELGGQGDHETLLAGEGGGRDARGCERLKVLVFAQVQVTVLQSRRFQCETGGDPLENGRAEHYKTGSQDANMHEHNWKQD